MPTEPQILLDWTPASPSVFTGAEMILTVIELDDGSLVTLYAHRDDLPKLPAAIAVVAR